MTTPNNLIAVISDVDKFLAVEQPQQVLHGIEVLTTQRRHVRRSDIQQHLHTSLQHLQ